MTPDSPLTLRTHAEYFQRLLRHDRAEAEYDVKQARERLARAEERLAELIEDEREGQAYIDALDETEADE